MLEPIALARQLIDIPSTTDHEAPHGEFLEQLFAKLGFSTRRLPVSDSRFNLYAAPAAAARRPRIVLNSHLDTVPPWFGSSEDEEFVHGRGACDTKGIIAAMIAAGERLAAGGRNDFAFLFVVGEETDSIGAKRANEDLRDLGSEYVLVGEPTGSKFARASKGAYTCTVRFDGVAAHSAYPELGDSAITRLVAAVAAINATDWGSHDVLGQATVNVGVIRGGEKPNIIPARAECEMIFRTVSEPEAVRRHLEAVVAPHGGTITSGRGNAPQFMTVPQGVPSIVVAFNTDVPHLGNLGKPLLYGPGSILDAHGEREKIRKKDLLQSIDHYCDAVNELCRN